MAQQITEQELSQLTQTERQFLEKVVIAFKESSGIVLQDILQIIAHEIWEQIVNDPKRIERELRKRTEKEQQEILDKLYAKWGLRSPVCRLVKQSPGVKSYRFYNRL